MSFRNTWWHTQWIGSHQPASYQRNNACEKSDSKILHLWWVLHSIIFKAKWVSKIYSGNLLIQSPISHKNLTVLSHKKENLWTGFSITVYVLFKYLVTSHVLRSFLKNYKLANIVFNLPWMFPTKHCFEKYNKKDMSPGSLRRYDWPILPIYA